MVRPEQSVPIGRLQTGEEALLSEARGRYLTDPVFHARVYAAVSATIAYVGSDAREEMTMAVSAALLMFPPAAEK